MDLPEYQTKVSSPAETLHINYLVSLRDPRITEYRVQRGKGQGWLTDCHLVAFHPKFLSIPL